MPKFHINPETGNPGPCSAKIQCRFGSESEHYSSADEARVAYEKQNSSSFAEVSKAPWDIERTRRELLKKQTDEIRAEAVYFAQGMEYDEALPAVVPLDDSLADENGVYYVESIDEFRDPEFAMNRCQDIAFAVEEYAERAGFMDGKLVAVHVEVDGEYLSRHTANTYKDSEGNDWIIDYSYSQVNSKADFPYVGLKSDWEKSLHEAAENPDPKVREVYERYEAELRASLDELMVDLGKKPKK
jgi:hypothetical protein